MTWNSFKTFPFLFNSNKYKEGEMIWSQCTRSCIQLWLKMSDVFQIKHSHVKRHSTGVPLKEVDVTARYLHSCFQQHQMISESAPQTNSHNLITHLVTHIILHTTVITGAFPASLINTCTESGTTTETQAKVVTCHERNVSLQVLGLVTLSRTYRNSDSWGWGTQSKWVAESMQDFVHVDSECVCLRRILCLQ